MRVLLRLGQTLATLDALEEAVAAETNDETLDRAALTAEVAAATRALATVRAIIERALVEEGERRAAPIRA